MFVESKSENRHVLTDISRFPKRYKSPAHILSTSTVVLSFLAFHPGFPPSSALPSPTSSPGETEPDGLPLRSSLLSRLLFVPVLIVSMKYEVLGPIAGSSQAGALAADCDPSGRDWAFGYIDGLGKEVKERDELGPETSGGLCSGAEVDLASSSASNCFR